MVTQLSSLLHLFGHATDILQLSLCPVFDVI